MNSGSNTIEAWKGKIAVGGTLVIIAATVLAVIIFEHEPPDVNLAAADDPLAVPDDLSTIELEIRPTPTPTPHGTTTIYRTSPYPPASTAAGAWRPVVSAAAYQPGTVVRPSPSPETYDAPRRQPQILSDLEFRTSALEHAVDELLNRIRMRN